MQSSAETQQRLAHDLQTHRNPSDNVPYTKPSETTITAVNSVSQIEPNSETR